MKTYKNETTELYATDSYNRVQIGAHSLQQPDFRATYAMDIIKHYGPALMLDTHPGSTRMTPAEVAKIAADISAAAFAEFSSRSWLIEIPSIEVLQDEARENRGKN